MVERLERLEWTSMSVLKCLSGPRLSPFVTYVKESEAIKMVRISINCFGFHLILSKQSQGRAKLRHTSFIGNQSVTLQTFFSSFLKVFPSDPSSLATQNKNSNTMTAFLRLSQISTRISTWAELNF